MLEEGTLRIVRRATVYQIRYASNNPYDPERPPYACQDEETLTTVLHHCGLEAAAIHQACMAAQTGGGGRAYAGLACTDPGLFSPAPLTWTSREVVESSAPRAPACCSPGVRLHRTLPTMAHAATLTGAKWVHSRCSESR
jgi:hypothetical protein